MTALVRWWPAAALLGCIAASNWALVNIGWMSPSGVRTVPVAPGLGAPSGVLFVGATLALRDVVHRTLGTRTCLAVIGVGALVSALVSPRIALASALTFLLAELADLGVYLRFLPKGYAHAAFVSNLVSAVVDSTLFLLIAFSTWSPSLVIGMTLGKLEAATLLLALTLRRHRYPQRSSDH